MESYIGHLVTVLATLGGLVGIYTRIIARIQKLETRLEIDDASKLERDRSRRLEMADIARSICETEYQRTATNPKMHQYPAPEK